MNPDADAAVGTSHGRVEFISLGFHGSLMFISYTNLTTARAS